MIQELEISQYKEMHELVHKEWDNIEIHAVLSGVNTGWVFADSSENPRTALLWSRGIEGFYFIGDPDNAAFNDEIASFVFDRIGERIVQSGLEDFEYSGDCEEWDDTLEAVFRNKQVKKSKQCVYKLDYECWYNHVKARPAKEAQVCRIDRNLFQRNGIADFSFLETEILRWWDSLDHFFNYGIGYCIVADDKIVSYCITNFVYENTYTIGIETLKEYRRRGYCQLAAEAFVGELLANHDTPYWDCMFTKTASRTLAEKLGFYLDHTYSLYRIPMNGTDRG